MPADDPVAALREKFAAVATAVRRLALLVLSGGLTGPSLITARRVVLDAKADFEAAYLGHLPAVLSLAERSRGAEPLGLSAWQDRYAEPGATAYPAPDGTWRVHLPDGDRQARSLDEAAAMLAAHGWVTVTERRPYVPPDEGRSPCR
jgi:hypothetical protein